MIFRKTSVIKRHRCFIILSLPLHRFSETNYPSDWRCIMIIKQIPPSLIDGKIYFADENGNILNAQGKIRKMDYSPGKQKHKGGSCYPVVKIANKNRNIHLLVCAAFRGLPMPGQVCHHLDGCKRNTRPANLLCWLTREQHVIADRRQRALRKLVPDLHGIPYERLRTLQDPRVTTDEQFAYELEQLKPGFKIVDPLILNDLELTKHYDPFVERS